MSFEHVFEFTGLRENSKSYINGGFGFSKEKVNAFEFLSHI